MYAGKQLKNEAENKVSRQVKCGTRQRVQIRDGRKMNESYSYSQDVSNSVFQPIKIIQRTRVLINDVWGHSPFENVAKKMDARNKIDFCDFLLNRNRTQYEIKDGKDDEDEVVCKENLPKDREEYYNKITDKVDRGNYWINWPANCTGDLPSMSTAILMGFKHGISISKNGNIDPKSRLDEVSAYLGGVIDKNDKDSRFIINDDGWKGTYDKSPSGGLKYSWLTRVVATGKYKEDKSGIEEIVNGIGYKKEDKDKVRKAWLGEDNVDEKIAFFLNSVYQLTPERLKNKLITVLWIRKSGERGGAHFENDASFKALKRYIETHTAGLIILAGDKKGTKTDDLKQKAKDRVYDLTEFWNMQGVAEWGGNTRTGQLRLYDYLNRISENNLKHIGSMSGGLEALALIGHDVHFKAKKDDTGVDRMEQYRNTSIKYNRIDFERWNTIGYNYAGFEKSAAKYFVFFSSGVIQGQVKETDLMNIYREKYKPTTDYKIMGGGLSGNNATVARTVSRELAKEEKMRLKERAKEILSNQKKKAKEIKMSISKGINPNRQTKARGKNTKFRSGRYVNS